MGFFKKFRTTCCHFRVQQSHKPNSFALPSGKESFRSLQNNVLLRLSECIDNRFGTLKRLNFISLACVQRFPEYRDTFPESALKSLFASPYSKYFEENELRVELILLYADTLLNTGTTDAVYLLKAIMTQGITDSLTQVVDYA